MGERTTVEPLDLVGTCIGAVCAPHVDELVDCLRVPSKHFIVRVNALLEGGVARREVGWQLGVSLEWLNKMLSDRPHPTVEELLVRHVDVLLSLTVRRAVAVWGLGEREALTKGEQQNENRNRTLTGCSWPRSRRT